MTKVRKEANVGMRIIDQPLINPEKGQNRLYDERDLWPEVEPLSLKLIRDEIKRQNLSVSFFRNVNDYYYAIIQLVTMRGQGCQFCARDITFLVGVGANVQTKCWKWLRDIGLIRIADKPNGGGRKTMFVYALRAPWANCQIPAPQNVGRETCVQDSKEPQNIFPAQQDVGEKEVREDSSSSSFYKDKKNSQKPKVSSKKPNPPKEAVVPSLKGWSHEMIVAHHQEHPDSPPVIEGISVKPEQALACAITTLPGYRDSPELQFASLYNILAKMIRKGMRGLPPDYTSWLDAALNLDRYPVPESGVTAAAYLIASLTNSYRQVKSRAWEARHEEFRHGEKLNDDGKEHVTWADIENAAQEAGIEI